MPPRRLLPPHQTRRIVVGLAMLASVAACRGDAPPVPVDSATAPVDVPTDSATTVVETNGWNASVGVLLLVPGQSPEETIVFLGPSSGDSLPASLDSAAFASDAVTLVGRGDVQLTATLERPAGADTPSCRVWRLRDVRSPSTGGFWSVGFVQGRVAPIALDSVDGLASRDSMALAAEASRLASAVTANTAPAFQGLRFSAHEIRRFDAAPGVQALAAHLVRKVNQEADPKEEQTLLIAERDSGVTTGPYQLAYAERTHGQEEEVSTGEVVAAVRIGRSPQPVLVLAREGEEGLAYALLERTGARRWRLRWTSTLARCGS